MLQRPMMSWIVALVLAFVAMVPVLADMQHHRIRMHHDIKRALKEDDKYYTPSRFMDVSSQYDMDHFGISKQHKSHGKLKVPKGSEIRHVKVHDTGTNFLAYFSKDVNEKKVTHAYVMFHGRNRDGDKYWSIMNRALESARKDNYPGAPKHAVVVAPQFFSAKLNEGQFGNSTLAWSDINAWQSGSVAVHPKGTDVSSMDAVDALVDLFSNEKKYPNLKNLTLVGHGGGGQLMNRYATVGKDSSRKGIHIRYIVGDPSTSAYFTYHRPMTDKSIASPETCKSYNNWRYGFDTFPGTLQDSKEPHDYFKQYISRDVVNIVGLKDVLENGDQKCMALLQGGRKRRDRNLSWWRYINMLGRTNENLHGFPGNFSDLPDWSMHSNGIIKTRLTVVPHVKHDAEKVFGSKHGRSALFDHYDVDMGWRPDGWTYHAPKARIALQNKKASSSSSSASSSSTSSSSTSSSSTSQPPSSTSLSSSSSSVSSSSPSSSSAPSESSLGGKVFAHDGSASHSCSLFSLLAPLVFVCVIMLL